MEERDSLIYEVVFDAKRAQEQAESLREVIARLRKERQETERDFKEGTITVQEYGKSMQAIESQLAGATAQLRNITKETDTYKKINDSAKGSVDQLRALVAALNAQYDEMPKSMRKSSEEGKRLTAQINALTKELKEAEEATGRNQRSVGDYAKGIRIGGQSVGETIEAVKGGVAAFKTFTTGINTARGAMIAFGAVPILLILAGLVALLSKAQPVMDKLAQYTKGASLAIDQLSNGVVRSVTIIRDAFTSWEKFTNLLPRLWQNAKQTASGMREAAAAGMSIAASLQQLEERETSLSVRQAQNRAQIERYKLLAEDTGKSNAARSAAAKKAYELENGVMQEAIGLQQQRVKLAQQEFDNSKKGRDDRKKLAEEEIKLADIVEDSVGKQTELNNNLNSIRQDGITKAKEAAALAAAEEVAHIERMIILARQKGQETLGLEEKLILAKAKEAKLEVKGKEQRTLIEAQAQADILALRIRTVQEVNQKLLEIEKSRITSSLALTLEGSKEERDLRIQEVSRQVREELLQLEASYKKKEITAEAYEEKLSAIVGAGNRQKDEIRKQYDVSEVNRLARMAESRLQTESDLSGQTIGLQRRLAADRIDLEERTQLKLLAIEQITDEERLNRQNAIQAKAIAARRELDKQLRLDRIAGEKLDAETLLALSRGSSQEEMKARIDLINATRREELEGANENAKAIKTINVKADREIADLRKDFIRQQVDLTVDAVNQSVSILNSLMTAQAEGAMKNLQQQQDAALKSAGLSAEARARIEEQFSERRLQLEREAAKQKKKFALIEAAMNTANAVIAAQKLPLPFNIIQSVLAAATGAAQIAIITSQQFARGGVVKGPSHASGGVKYWSGRVELEGEEGVINKRSMSIPWVRREASRLNQIGGGVAFDGIGYQSSRRMEFGGITPYQNNSGMDYSTLRQALSDALKEMPRPVVAVEDIQTGVNRKVAVEAYADIRK